MAGKKWTETENQILVSNYSNLITTALLKLLPDRSWEACKTQANKLGLKRIYNEAKNNKMNNLLNETNEAFYWLGLIYSDGSLNFKQKRISIKLKKSDGEYLKNVAKFFETKFLEDKRTKYIAIADSETFPQIVEKFGFKEQKTYNPPKNLSFLKTKEQFIAFLAGFIDGDGSIRNQTNRKDCVISIKNHSSWIHIFNEIEEQLYRYLNIERTKRLSKINNSGYAFICFSNRNVVNSLKEEVLKLNLPVMERKWSKIDLNLRRIRLQKGLLEERVIELFNQGLRKSDIAKKLNVSKSTISNIFKPRK